ncbi:MAG: Calx-beta domain-containing protein [Acidobacteriota bacterium]
MSRSMVMSASCGTYRRRGVLLVGISAWLVLAFAAAGPLAAVPVNGTVGIDPNNLAGVDGAGRVLLFAPNPLQQGSSISHFDASAFPDLLMEPSNSSSLAFQQTDLTVPQMRDIGWPAGSSNITLRIQDAPGQGFNDPALGGQRLAAMQQAVAVWANVLRSSVEINVSVGFESLTCNAQGATLAQAGAEFVFESFAGAPVSGTWYHGALAESLSGQNLSLDDVNDPNAGDLALTFNSQIDTGCLGGGSRYYYGLNGNVPAGQISFVSVALHELAHGLGFSTFTNLSTGALFLGRPDIFSRFIFDNTQGQTWNQMSNAQRRNSAVNSLQVAWSGNQVRNQAPNFLDSAPTLRINSPASIAGFYTVGLAQFGPPVAAPGITGELAQAVDGSAAPTLLCNPVVNGAEVVGKIALADRGDCNFTVKVRNAQAAGAIAVVVANNTAGAPPAMGGNDPAVVIPSVSITQADGALIRATLDSGGAPGALRFESSSFTVAENAGMAPITVRRSGGTDGEVSVDFATADGTATADEDYTPAAGTITFADGEGGTKTFDVEILDDAVTESDETVALTLQNPGGGASLGSPSTAELTITNDDVNPAGVLALVGSLFQVDEGGGNAVLGVERLGGTLGAVSVDFATSDGSAVAGEDYEAATGTVAFGDGEGGVKTFEVAILDDAIEEDLEALSLTLANPAGGAGLGQTQASLEIIDNEPCVPTDTRLCLNQGRFRVEVAWRDFQDQTGPGRVEPLASDDSGLFWFFNAENLEMLVKVLDGCGFNDRFWVFAAATTDVQYTLTVTDKETGQVQQYTNPLGVASDAVTDTDAFATCPGSVGGGGGQTVEVARLAELERAEILATLEQRTAGTVGWTEKVGACQPSANVLCLNQGRFRVEITWTDFQGVSGAGQVEPLVSDDSGLFWFFSQNNLELLVKVLDGCGFNDHFWVFAAATTDVAYTLTVTDTASGEVRQYSNPLGVASPAVTDTGAFPTCP